MTDQFEMFNKVSSIDRRDGTHKCNTCGVVKSVNSFEISRYKKDGVPARDTSCLSCNNKSSRLRKKYRENNPPPENHVCPICNISKEGLREKYKGGLNSGTATRPVSKAGWVCDHDHQTDSFRGWLCHTCNLGLGLLKDSENNLRRAIEYLEKYRDDA